MPLPPNLRITEGELMAWIIVAVIITVTAVLVWLFA